MRDFTLRQLELLYDAILQNGYSIIRYDQYVRQDSPRGKYIILRHDVDARPEQALKLAHIEKDRGIKSSYYFRNKAEVFKKEIIQEIASLDHEIGYHYEDLVTHKGDLTSAIRAFETSLHEFRELYPVSTICMHGSPLSKYNNSDLWNHYHYKQFGITGDVGRDISFGRHWYLTDTGRGWNTKYNLRDRIPTVYNIPVKDTASLIDLFQSRKIPSRILMNIHPQRWREEYSSWASELIQQSVKNMIKLFYINQFSKL
jgi:hypothetical protein